LLSSDQPSNIIVEINFPLQGINPKIGGVFARDATTNEVFLLHRGGIGGGRQGIGRRAFLAWYKQVSPGRLIGLEEGKRAADKCILVGHLVDDELLGGIYSLVQSVRNFKNSVSNR
jgi:5-methylcytosine-specific restriction protein A